MIDIDIEMTATVNDLLRSEPRLLAAGTLIGHVAVVYREAKPVKAPKKPPLRADGSPVAPVAEESGEVTATVGPAALPSPWHKTAVVAKANGLAKFDDGRPILATVTVDGSLWECLGGAGQRAALVLALRGLRGDTDKEGATIAVVERPPVRTWPDTTGEASELMAQLGPDGAAGAALIGALTEPDEVANLGAAISAFRRRLDAGQQLTPLRGILRDLADALDTVVDDVWARRPAEADAAEEGDQ